MVSCFLFFLSMTIGPSYDCDVQCFRAAPPRCHCGGGLIDRFLSQFLQPAQPPLSPAEISGPTVSELMSDKFED